MGRILVTEKKKTPKLDGKIRKGLDR